MKMSEGQLFHNGGKEGMSVRTLAVIALVALGFGMGRPARAVVPEPDNIIVGSLTFEGQAPAAKLAGLVIDARQILDGGAAGPKLASYRVGDRVEDQGRNYVIKLRVRSSASGQSGGVAPGANYALFLGQTRVSPVYTLSALSSSSNLLKRLPIDVQTSELPGNGAGDWTQYE